MLAIRRWRLNENAQLAKSTVILSEAKRSRRIPRTYLKANRTGSLGFARDDTRSGRHLDRI